MDVKTKRLQRYYERRDFALSKVEDHIVLAKIDLQWAEKDRKHGLREEHLESMRLVAHHREKALWWYARYQKKCQQIAELERGGLA